jgi:hypothetical protein
MSTFNFNELVRVDDGSGDVYLLIGDGVRAALTAAGQGTPTINPNAVYEAVKRTMLAHGLAGQSCKDDPGTPYPLIDALTPEGESVAAGKEEIERLAGEIWWALRPILNMPHPLDGSLPKFAAGQATPDPRDEIIADLRGQLATSQANYRNVLSAAGSPAHPKEEKE